VGRVGQNTDRLLDGCQIIHGLQIDPGFSGLLFVRALNISEGEMVLRGGDVLVTAEISRLPQLPHEAHQGTLDSRIARTSMSLYRRVSELFSYKVGDDGVAYKAIFKGAFDKTLVCEAGEDIEEEAISWVIQTLGDASSIARGHVEVQLEEAMDKVAISEEEAEALMIRASVPKAKFDSVLSHFVGERRQSLADTVKRMSKRPSEIGLTLLDHVRARRHDPQFMAAALNV
jgi:hypothetical protein